MTKKASFLISISVHVWLDS